MINNSPTIVPPKRRSQRARKCRRKLCMEYEWNDDCDNNKKDEASNPTVSLAGEDFSGNETDYVPETDSDSSVESFEELPKKSTKKKKKKQKRQRYAVLKENNEIKIKDSEDLPETTMTRSMFNTPTSSTLASCVPSPLYDSNGILSLVNISTYIDDIFENTENIDPENENLNTGKRNIISENVNTHPEIKNIYPFKVEINITESNYINEDHSHNIPESICYIANSPQASTNLNTIPKLSYLAWLKIHKMTSNQNNITDKELNKNENLTIEITVEQNDDEQGIGQDDTDKFLSRKRKRDEHAWKDRINKHLKNSGKSYTSVRSNKGRNEKEMGALCNCKKECFKKIPNDQRRKIFENFWKIGNHERQWDYILRYISSQNIKRMQLERKSNRSQTIIYNLPINATDREVVCKKMFLNTLGITEKWVYTAIEKKDAPIIEDLRGKHYNRPRKMSEITEKSIIDHINQFPVVDSHYTRKESNRLYLSETLNISKMYRLYKTWYGEQTDIEPTHIMASKSQYVTIFNTRFNYSFFKPKKDLCDICFIYENADDDRKKQLKTSQDVHIQEKEAIRKLKNAEKANSDQNRKSVACFDLEKVLNIPQSEVNRFYYKRKYAVYNFTIYDVLFKKGFCYVWHQQIAKRGAIEIGSCLWHYIHQEVIQNGKTEISFYSDSCAGQNRNRFVFSMYQHASRVLGVDICHRFFEKGHSQSEGDTMHSCVERAKRHQIVYTPEQMYCIISNAKVEGQRFSIKEMSQSDFYDLKQLVNRPGINWFKDDNDQKVLWSKVKEIKIKHTDPDKIIFKYSLLDESEERVLTTTKVFSRRRRRTNNTEEVISLVPAYSDPIPIPRPLYNDLMDLCSSGAIPKAYHDFYNKLIPQNSSEPSQENDSSDLE